MSAPPPIGVPPSARLPPLSPEAATRAIETAKAALAYIVVGPPLIRYGPAGEVHVDVPLLYHGMALDRVHFDPSLKMPSPKGRPGRAWGVRVDEHEVRSVMEAVLKESRVLDAVEYREPEAAWAVPLAWRNFIIAHIKVSHDGMHIIPDYGLTEEVRRYVSR